jgi:hypothetical protein
VAIEQKPSAYECLGLYEKIKQIGNLKKNSTFIREETAPAFCITLALASTAAACYNSGSLLERATTAAALLSVSHQQQLT